MHAYRRQEEPALKTLDQVIAYAQAAGKPWLEANAWLYEQANGRLDAARARGAPADQRAQQTRKA